MPLKGINHLGHRAGRDRAAASPAETDVQQTGEAALGVDQGSSREPGVKDRVGVKNRALVGNRTNDPKGRLESCIPWPADGQSQ